ncbi:DUF1566 domain-containing protein [Alkalimonas delamerensis]|uniref:DUF1566 domain-containing protein n=1 Tax=Alkalimonas delamerensis TaxID=265981 RepID=A0ABT9GRN5_9GAMM|nr:DUF1566 domain-containing protein [Alkalimonas delamerensis]MDP4529652.1 DUF1566 domain-containing protein [Alkalimonas delamerensis]
MRVAVIIAVLLTAQSLLAEQVCFEDIAASTPLSDFEVLPDGLVHQRSTGLIWQRCLYGQNWSQAQQRCEGTAVRLSWQEALQQSTMLADYSQHWRLPDIKEAMAIVERRCVDPALRRTLFAGANSEHIWTNTSIHSRPTHAWAIAMYSGKNNYKEKNQQLYVRFVRFSDE